MVVSTVSHKNVSLLVRLWVEMPLTFSIRPKISSASLWGCELKYSCIYISGDSLYVSLLVRLWVEITFEQISTVLNDSQPPCEAVSWNDAGLLYSWFPTRQPPCEAVSWNTPAMVVCSSPSRRQPPCEAVSWNRLRGRQTDFSEVSLLVRLWVEINYIWKTSTETIRQPPCEAVSWNKW